MKKLLVVMLILIAGMSSPVFAADKKIVLGKVPYTLEHAYHQVETKTLKEYAAKKYNVKVIIVDGEASNEATLAAVENLISQKVDGIGFWKNISRRPGTE